MTTCWTPADVAMKRGTPAHQYTIYIYIDNLPNKLLVGVGVYFSSLHRNNP